MKETLLQQLADFMTTGFGAVITSIGAVIVLISGHYFKQKMAARKASQDAQLFFNKAMKKNLEHDAKMHHRVAELKSKIYDLQAQFKASRVANASYRELIERGLAESAELLFLESEVLDDVLEAAFETALTEISEISEVDYSDE